MKRIKSLLSFLLALLMLTALAGCSAKADDTIRFGTAGTGGNYYAYGNVLSQLAEEEAQLNLEVKTTAGSAANLRLLQKGFLQLAIAQSDTLLDAASGTGSFDAPLSGYSAVAALYTEACQIIVAADSDIQSVSDLMGMRVSVGETDSGVIRNAEQILLSNGLTFDMLQTSNLSFSDSAAALEAGELDAFFVTAGAPTTAVAELARETDIRILSLDDASISRLVTQYPCYAQTVIPAGTYQGQSEDVTTVGLKAILVASDKLSADTVEQITGVLFDHASDLKYATNVTESPVLENVLDFVPVGFHPGAAAFYEKQGISVPVGGDGIIIGVTAAQDAS